MAMPQSNRLTGRSFRPLLTFLLIVGIIVGALTAYVSTEPKLDWAHEGAPDLAEKVQTMIRERSLTTTITEPELEALVKASLYEERLVAEGVMLTGADVALADETLTIITDVMMGGKLRVQLTHQFHLAWEAPYVAATHESTHLKAIPLPISWFRIGVISVPIQLDERVPAQVKQVTFEEDEVKVRLELVSPFQ